VVAGARHPRGRGLLFWHVRRNHGMLSGLRPVAIWLLETCLVALILLLLWHRL